MQLNQMGPEATFIHLAAIIYRTILLFKNANDATLTEIHFGCGPKSDTHSKDAEKKNDHLFHNLYHDSYTKEILFS